MDVTDEARISLGAPVKRRSFAVIAAALTIALVLLAALLVWRVTAIPKPDAPPGSRGAVGTVGVEDLPIIGDHRPESLSGAVPVPGTILGHSATGPHPPQKDPKQG
ncbi:MAG TPA: hypothetical protein VFI59_03240 [Actinomycetota bacterium]|nr:hypothetical protein [Actinomycetota bacterium]